MTRMKIGLPNKFNFECDLIIQIGDINYGGHLSNDAILRIAHEARLQFLKKMNLSEIDIGGVGLIMRDSAIVYKSQGFHGDHIKIKIALSDLNPFGFNLIYQIIKTETELEIARLKTGLVCFDYKTNKLSPIPDSFKETFSKTF